jgi:hypothetical protein
MPVIPSYFGGLQFQISLGKKKVCKAPPPWEKAGNGGMHLSSQQQQEA